MLEHERRSIKKLSLIRSVRYLILLSILLIFGACGPAVLPTPTIVPLDRGASNAEEAEAQQAAATPTSTPLPLPSPTPTSTPFPTATSVATTAVTSTVTLTTSTVISGTGPQVQILSPALNIRQGPGVAYPAIGTALAGETFAVTGVDPTRYWLQITTTNGQPGWISGQAPYAQLVKGDLQQTPVISGPTLPAAPAPGSGGVVPAPPGGSTGS